MSLEPLAARVRRLGRDLVAHPGNARLRRALDDGEVSADAWFAEVIRIAYAHLIGVVASRRGLRAPTAGLFSASYPPLVQAHVAAPALSRIFEGAVDEGLSAEALGGAYQRLLEWSPRLTRANDGAYAFDLDGREGDAKRARRTTGSYYTPDALMRVLVDGALEPVVRVSIDKHIDQSVPALLDLRVVDPSCGSGHFLVAAARAIAAHVARLRGDGDRRRAFRDVAKRCIHGVDLNPLAAELCKVSLWMECADPELDLAVFDASIRSGNALLGGVEAWRARFPAVFDRGGFDVVLGNPPWIAHAGRAAQALEPELKRYYEATYEAFAHYPTTHGLFIGLAPALLRQGGRLGLVVPSSVSELAGYAPTRRAHDRLADFPDELVDFGEGQFEGVTQPCMALVSKRTEAGRSDDEAGAPWPMARPDLGPVDRALLARLKGLGTVPAELFGERGVQSDKSLAAHFFASATPHDRFTTPIREGTDVREFELLSPRFHVDRAGLGARVRSPEEFSAVRVLVRQTARHPVAALSDGGAFRNSLLAAFELDAWPPLLTLALLNSTLVRWHHYQRYRDARQPIMPQVKIGHLRSIPVPRDGFARSRAALVDIVKKLVEAPNGPESGLERARLDATIADAYELTDVERATIDAWRVAMARRPTQKTQPTT